MPNPEDSPYICWIDLETTGNNPDSHIIEFGAAMTDREFNVLDTISLVGALYPGDIPSMKEGDGVPFLMHTENGLIEAALADGMSLTEMDLTAVKWMKKFTKGDHVPLAGSGVSHFDRPKFLEKDLPKFSKFLSYWAYDIGTLRRILKLIEITAPDTDKSIYKTHRALDDALVHIDEMRAYKRLLSRLRPQVADVTGWHPV